MSDTIQHAHATAARDALAAFALSPEGRALAADYLRLLERVDVAFASHSQGDPARMVCQPTCCDCCRGVFEITVLDALLLAVALADKPPADPMRQAASGISGHLSASGWAFPHFWGSWEDDAPFQQLDNTPCPLLTAEGLCHVYAMRPSVCRFQGLVFADPRGDLILDDDCPRRDTAPPPALLDLRDFYASEDERYGRLLASLPTLGGFPMESWDTVIAGVVGWTGGEEG